MFTMMKTKSSMIRGIIIGHGTFAQAMVDTAEKIVGKQSDIDVISNTGFSGGMLCDKIAEVINSTKDQETIIFVDLPGGSCSMSCYSLLKNSSDLNIICGLNLPMLIEFLILREKHAAQELVPILIKKGRDNIFRLAVRK